MAPQDIMECNTVKECYLWADRQWPGFWKLVTKQPLTEEERHSLTESSDDEDPLFQKFLRQLMFVGKLDQSKEALKLLIMGASCMMSLDKNPQEENKDHHKKYN